MGNNRIVTFSSMDELEQFLEVTKQEREAPKTPQQYKKAEEWYELIQFLKAFHNRRIDSVNTFVEFPIEVQELKQEQEPPDFIVKFGQNDIQYGIELTEATTSTRKKIERGLEVGEWVPTNEAAKILWETNYSGRDAVKQAQDNAEKGIYLCEPEYGASPMRRAFSDIADAIIDKRAKYSRDSLVRSFILLVYCHRVVDDTSGDHVKLKDRLIERREEHPFLDVIIHAGYFFYQNYSTTLDYFKDPFAES